MRILLRQYGQPISLTIKSIHQRKTITLSKFTSGIIDLPRGLWRVLYEYEYEYEYSYENSYPDSIRIQPYSCTFYSAGKLRLPAG
eukprot:COSAG01_NODE_36277_length_519_cov_18.159524_1_plen_85_part_00